MVRIFKIRKVDPSANTVLSKNGPARREPAKPIECSGMNAAGNKVAARTRCAPSGRP